MILFCGQSVDSMNDKKQIFAWCMYDFANSAYMTTVAGAVLPAYFAAVIIPAEGFRIGDTIYSASALWGFMISASVLFIFLVTPFLGAISDFSASKKKFLMFFCYTGCLFTTLLYFSKAGNVWLTIIFFMITQIDFAGGNVFYDAFLPQIASEDKLDRVSGKGFAPGYVGGSLYFSISLLIIAGHNYLGLAEDFSVRIVMALAGLWWGGFAIVTFINLKEPGSAEKLPRKYRNLSKWPAYAKIGFKRTISTILKTRHSKHLLLFLAAFAFYNNGIQTVISMAIIYGKKELKLSTTFLMIALGLWSIVTIYAYVLTTATEFFIMGVITGSVLGGSFSLSRSLYGSMIPVTASAEFYSFYAIVGKFSTFWGPLAYALIRQFTGSARLSIISLIIFFISGIFLLIFVDVEKAKSKGGNDIFVTL